VVPPCIDYGLAVAFALGLVGTAMPAAVSDRADVPSARSTRSIMILSEGQSTCGAYNTQPHMQAVRASLVLGYISGVNSRSPAPEALAGRSFHQARRSTSIRWIGDDSLPGSGQKPPVSRATVYASAFEQPRMRSISGAISRHAAGDLRMNIVARPSKRTDAALRGRRAQ